MRVLSGQRAEPGVSSTDETELKRRCRRNAGGRRDGRGDDGGGGRGKKVRKERATFAQPKDEPWRVAVEMRGESNCISGSI